MDFARWLGKKLHFNTAEDWYTVTLNDMVNHHASGLARKYNYSMRRLVTTIFSEHRWLAWRFTILAVGYWDNPQVCRIASQRSSFLTYSCKQNQRGYMDWLGKELNYDKMDDWYSVTLEDIVRCYGSGLAGKYNNSPRELIMAVYIEHNWLMWKFAHVPLSYWDNLQVRLTNVFCIYLLPDC